MSSFARAGVVCQDPGTGSSCRDGMGKTDMEIFGNLALGERQP